MGGVEDRVQVVSVDWNGVPCAALDNHIHRTHQGGDSSLGVHLLVVHGGDLHVYRMAFLPVSKTRSI